MGWEAKHAWIRVHNMVAKIRDQQEMDLVELSRYNGRDGRETYLSAQGVIWDVSTSPSFGFTPSPLHNRRQGRCHGFLLYLMSQFDPYIAAMQVKAPAQANQGGQKAILELKSRYYEPRIQPFAQLCSICLIVID